MSEFTLTLIKLAFLAVLWLFVIAAVGVIRADMFGSSKAAARAAGRARAPRRTARPRQRPEGSRRPPQPAGPRRLVVTQGDRAGLTMELSPGVPITIGRANDATIVVADDYASSRHARLYAQNGQWIVEDLGSTNGTYLNGEPLRGPQPLHVGDRIRIGDSEFTFER